MYKPWILSQSQISAILSFQLIRESVDSLPIEALALFWSSILSMRLIMMFSHQVSATFRQHLLWSQSLLPKASPRPSHPTKAHILHILPKSIWCHQCSVLLQYHEYSCHHSCLLLAVFGWGEECQMPKLSIIWSNWQLWRSELGRNLLNNITSYVN